MKPRKKLISSGCN